MVNQLRIVKPAVIARIEYECLILDPRTVLPRQDAALITGLKSVLNGGGIIEEKQ